jgi:hypothetical protein
VSKRLLSKRFLGRILLVGAIMCAVAAVPGLIISSYVAYMTFVPRYSAIADFSKLGFNVRLDLFRTRPGESHDSGRYLNVIKGMADHSFMLPGWDWQHKARTSLYFVDANHIAVLSPMGADYLVTVEPFAAAPVAAAPVVVAPAGEDQGAGWRYLGAFDFLFPSGEPPRLEFFDSQLAECVPMGPGDPAGWADKPRAQARRASCPTPTMQEP